MKTFSCSLPDRPNFTAKCADQLFASAAKALEVKAKEVGLVSKRVCMDTVLEDLVDLVAWACGQHEQKIQAQLFYKGKQSLMQTVIHVDGSRVTSISFDCLKIVHGDCPKDEVFTDGAKSRSYFLKKLIGLENPVGDEDKVFWDTCVDRMCDFAIKFRRHYGEEV